MAVAFAAAAAPAPAGVLVGGGGVVVDVVIKIEEVTNRSLTVLRSLQPLNKYIVNAKANQCCPPESQALRFKFEQKAGQRAHVFGDLPDHGNGTG